MPAQKRIDQDNTYRCHTQALLLAELRLQFPLATLDNAGVPIGKELLSRQPSDHAEVIKKLEAVTCVLESSSA